jgi:uncharacterized protein YbjT (DUF2867 family)
MTTFLLAGRERNADREKSRFSLVNRLFFETILAPMIRAGLLHVPFGTGRHAPIAAEDQARVIAGILENPTAHRSHVYPLFGPVQFTYAEIAQVLSRVLNVAYSFVRRFKG